MQFISIMGKLIFISLSDLKQSEKWGVAYLKKIEQEYNGKFDEALIKKVAKYQSIQLHFVANTFSGLFNRKNNNAEIERNIQYFLMTVLYDELTDELKVDEMRVHEISYHPSKVTPNNFKERVLIAMHLSLLEQVPNEIAYWEIVKQIHLAQKDSAKQFNAQTSLDEIIDITKRKGGYSLLMCRHYLIDKVDKNIDQCWYSLGGLIQMTNDLYDTYKDTQEGICTFANGQDNITHIEAIYNKQKMEFNNNIKKLPVENDVKLKFAIQTSIISAFGDIAINQLKMVQLNNNDLLQFKEMPRKSLIIDMEKWINKYRLLKFAYKNGKLWM